MEISLKGRKALVGGASRGLGKAIALQLAESGATVTVMARNEEKLQSVVASLPVEFGQEHQYLTVDFTDFAKFEASVTAYFNNYDVDILVNNTNGPSAGGALDKSIIDYQQAFDLLFKTTVFLSTQALSGMRTRKYGRIINLASVSVKEPLQNLVLSNSIRSAVATWAKTLSLDVASYGITVNNILTGYFDTERLNEIYGVQASTNNMTVEEYKNKMKANIPARRFGDPSEFGSLVAFLASDQAAYITGANIPIDGGLLKSL
jgi:3-oxoacyl-[acyl-carrier protein] reductase